MSKRIDSFKRVVVKFIINNFLSCTRFFDLKIYLLRMCNIKIGSNTKVVGPIYFGNTIKISIGDNCWIGKDIHLDGDGEVRIENNIDIAPHVTINTGGHLIGDEKRRAGKGIINKIVIGSGSWIGTRTVIVNNTYIAPGCVIAAGSVVIKDTVPNTLLAGVPAIKKKFLDCN